MGGNFCCADPRGKIEVFAIAPQKKTTSARSLSNQYINTV